MIMVADSVNVLNGTELYTEKWLKWQFYDTVFYYSLNKFLKIKTTKKHIRVKVK